MMDKPCLFLGGPEHGKVHLINDPKCGMVFCFPIRKPSEVSIDLPSDKKEYDTVRYQYRPDEDVFIFLQ